MRQFARIALTLLAAAGILLGGQTAAGSRAIAAPAQGLAAADAARPGLTEKTGYRHRSGRYDCTKVRHYDGGFDLYCRRRARLVKKYLCDRHTNGPDWRMHCKVIWVRMGERRGRVWRHGRY